LALERMKRTPPYLVAIFLDILLPCSYIQFIPKQVLIISSIIFLIKTRKFRRFQWITM
jgi:hypothetical protein